MTSLPASCLGKDFNGSDWNKIMPNNDPAGSPGRGSAEWNRAWTTISRLAAARQAALRELLLAPAGAPALQPTVAAMQAQDGADATSNPLGLIDQGQLDSAIAEIEAASAALKFAEPALQAWSPDAANAPIEPRKPRSVWVLIGTIWIAIALVVAGVVGTIGYLFN
jgi:hypothetical protein